MYTAFHIPYKSKLDSYVSMIWEVIGARKSSETILPQGIVEIVFNFGDQIQGFMPGGSMVSAPRCFIQGIHTESMRSDYLGQHHLLGIRLYPHAIQPLLGILPSDLNNALVDLALIDPLFDSLWHQLADLTLFEQKVSLLHRALPELTKPTNDRAQFLSSLFLNAAAEGFQSVDELAQQVCYSPRQLNRLAHNLFGLSAEELTLYKKFVEAVKHIHAGNNTLTEVAYNAGFYDQAHFCRVFKSFTGMTPNQYRKQKGPLAFHIIDIS